MNQKILLIIQREFLSRVKKKSFLIMTILGPLLMAGVILSRFWLEMIPEEPQTIVIVDETKLFNGKLIENEGVKFEFLNKEIILAKKDFYTIENNILLYIPSNILQGQAIQVYYKKQPSLETVSYLQSQVNTKLQDFKLLASGIDQEKLAQTKTKVKVLSTKVAESGEEETSNSALKILIGFLGGFLIYLFVFLYGSQVMRGVIEEKSNRIIEVIISSVKPFELMMGKIIGIACVGLLQFLLWVILTFGFSSMAMNFFASKNYNAKTVEETFKSNSPVQQNISEPEIDISASETLQSLAKIDFVLIISLFIFYFLGGYLLYGALFAAIGAAVDNEADTQQFILPITAPLIIAFIAAQVVIKDPESQMAFWFSIIPFTSPVVMMVRIPFGIPIWQVGFSMILLVAGFILTTWFAAKIYRTGILMYGKKPTFKELSKWLFYKN
ncbi:MAG: ABC transporter permease [Bacteroidota bacterium]|jgi:ABC-2 type transport system permease protein